MKNIGKKIRVGNKLYIPSSFHVYRGVDDFIGGIAVIKKIEMSKILPITHINSTMVVFEERPNIKYNLRSIIEQQRDLKRKFGKAIAHPDSDLRPNFNQPKADWHWLMIMYLEDW